MKDPRILASSGFWQGLPERIVAARQALAADPHREAVKSAVQAALKAQPTTTDTEALSLAIESSLQGVPLVRQVRDTLRSNDSGLDPSSDAARWLIGQTLGETDAHGEADKKSLARFERLRHDRVIYAAWRESFLDTLRADKGARDRWLTLGLGLADWESELALNSAVSRHSWLGLRQAIRDWRVVTDAFEAWWHHVEVDWFLSRPLELLWLPLELDRPAWVGRVDTLPHPALVERAVTLAGTREDGGLLRELLTLSPPTFDEHGRWTRSLLTLALVDSILDYPAALADAVANPQTVGLSIDVGSEAAKRLRAEEIPAWLGDIFNTLLDRTDGRLLGIAYLGRLASDLLRPESQGRFARRWLHQAAFESLADGLARHDVALKEIEDFATRREREQARTDARIGPATDEESARANGEGARKRRVATLPFLLGAIECCLQRHPLPEETRMDGDARRPIPSETVAALWAWFARLVIERDPGIDDVVREDPNATQLGSSLLGYVLALQPDSETVWSKLWRETEPQRRRFAYRGALVDGDALFPSALLLRVGLMALVFRAHWDRLESSRSNLLSHFGAITEGALWLWTLAGERHEHCGRAAVIRCFVHAPGVFGDGFEAAIAPLVPHVATDPGMACSAAWHLWKNGADLNRVEALFNSRGAGLHQAFEAAREWHRLTEDAKSDVTAFEAFDQALMGR